MRRLLMVLAVVLVAGYVVGFVELEAQTPPKTNDGWFLLSWKDPILTLHHKGYLYVVKCDHTFRSGVGGLPGHTSETCAPAFYIGSTLENLHINKEPHPFALSVGLGSDIEISQYGRLGGLQT